jgi:hypothetical protein
MPIFRTVKSTWSHIKEDSIVIGTAVRTFNLTELYVLSGLGVAAISSK